MKFTLSKEEVQALLAKALSVPADTVKITVKDLAVEVTKSVEELSFSGPIVTAPVVAIQEVAEELPAETTEDAPVAAKTKAKPKAKAKAEPVVEEEIEAEDIADDDDDIDFL